MFRVLLVKELREHVLSLRFQAGLVLTLLILCASATVLSFQHRAKIRDYHERLNSQDRILSEYAHYNRIAPIVQASRPPASMALVRGLAEDSGTESLMMNPLAELSGSLDLTAIAGTILSLFGVALGYDAISGEKERRTLGMILANRVRRSTVLIAKWGAGSIVLALAILPGALAAAAIVLLFGGTWWNADVWLSYATACCGAQLYATTFFSAALATSAICRSSALSALTALFGWVAGVFIVPNISPYVAAQFARVPAVAALERDIRFITSEERDAVGQTSQNLVMQKYRGLFPENISYEDAMRLIEADPERRRAYESMRVEVEEVWRETNRAQREKADRLLASWNTLSERQFRLSRMLSCAAAPYPPLLFALTELSATGFETKKHFERQAKAFDSVIGAYLESRYREEQAKVPSFGVNDFLDVSTRPRFRYVEPTFAERLDTAAPYLSLLALWNGIMLAGALVLFARYDPR